MSVEIKNIPYPKVRRLAKMRSDVPAPHHLTFDWQSTPEGMAFWHFINMQQYNKAKELQPELFTALPRSKKQELAWNCGSVLGSIAMAEVNLGRVNTMNALIASKVLTNTLAKSTQRQRLNSTLRELRERQDILDQALHNLQRETKRLHALAKEVLANDNKE
jgi:hypothetical protein